MGFDTKKAIKNASNVQEKHLLPFRIECRNMLKTIVSKLMNRSPFTYAMTKVASCLDPAVIHTDSKLAKKRFEKMLTIMTEYGRISGSTADMAVKQFRSIIELIKNDKFDLYDRKKERLDLFWCKLLIGEKFSELLLVVKMICCLSHGNANIERGFSINSECLFENMREESVVARRVVYDAVMDAGGLNNLQISTKLVQRARNSHSLYLEDKERRRKNTLDADKAKLLKRQPEAEATTLEKKRRQILEATYREA